MWYAEFSFEFGSASGAEEMLCTGVWVEFMESPSGDADWASDFVAFGKSGTLSEVELWLLLILDGLPCS